MRLAVSHLQIEKAATVITVRAVVAQLNDGESGESLLQRRGYAPYPAKVNV